jgi:putative ABC transport system permease protein
MLALRDNLWLSVDALQSHKLRAALTILGLTMGVATLITVMTIVQGANTYVEQKIANLGTSVFRVARTPFAVADFSVITKALKNKHIEYDDMLAVRAACHECSYVGGSANSSLLTTYKNKELQDTTLYGYTANMAEIDTRTLLLGRYFSEIEDSHNANVCLIGESLVQEFFPDTNPVGRTLRAANQEFLVIGTFEKIGSVLGQDQDKFLIIPLSTFLKFRGSRNSLTIEVKATDDPRVYQAAQDEVTVTLRARRHHAANQENDFFIGTAQSYLSLWQSISGAFFGVFIMVSSISAVVGGIVIMNVMLVSVTERTKEIGIRRAIGATQQDVLSQFLAESVIMCLLGGLIGVGIGFACALGLRSLTSFPAAVKTWVAVLGVILSSGIGMFFGIYPAVKASKLDPVTALRAD